MKTFVVFLFFSFALFSDNCIAQSLSYPDSLQDSIHKTPEQKLRLASQWLRDLIITEDSIINLMATRANQELKNQTDSRYIMFIVSSLLDTKRDTAIHVIANHLAVCPYVRETHVIDLMTKKKTFPALKAIEAGPLLQINILKDYLVSSGYLSKNLSNDEISILHYLLVKYPPSYIDKLNPARYTGNAFKNAQSILEWKAE